MPRLGTGRPLRDIDPSELVEHHLFDWTALADPDHCYCLANTVLVGATTAKSIKARRSPDQYRHKISAQIPDMLRHQQIPDEPELWTPQNFHKLAEARTAMAADEATNLVTPLQQGRCVAA